MNVWSIINKLGILNHETSTLKNHHLEQTLVELQNQEMFAKTAFLLSPTEVQGPRPSNTYLFY